eukprot:TRINITY_DN8906_c2_g2_i2.p1 TRINITY_DN8906_c2_g2~~TRINITY_DN8906_c2_g2_i2.p1  ORF type:complete len:165 (+),score=13.75 TRINITY_DN8906_c2_g2_i2:246-740(+)
MLFCLVGPPCERHYSSGVVLRVLVCTSIAVAFCHWFFGPRNAQVFGLSGCVFSMIMLNSIAGFRQQMVPASALLTALLWIAKEVWPILLGRWDGISHGSHLVGAVVGGYCGYAVSLNRLMSESRRRSLSDWLEYFNVSRRRSSASKFSEVSKKMGQWLQGGKTK